MAGDIKHSQKFFDNEVKVEEIKASRCKQNDNKVSPMPPRRIATMDFYTFYQQEIRARVQQKRQEERKAAMECRRSSTVLIGPIDDDTSHPPFILLGELLPGTPVDEVLPRRPPQRRAATCNLNFLKE